MSYYSKNTALYTSGTPYEKMMYDEIPGIYPYTNCSFEANSIATSEERAFNTKGLLVAKQSYKLESGFFPGVPLTEVYYYDKYSRLIQTVKINQLGYKEIISNDYNFTGQIIQTQTKQYYSSTDYYCVYTYFKYDHRGRIIQTDYQVNRSSYIVVPRTVVSAMVYNEAGQLKTKYLHSQNDQAFLQKVDYKYNIRGWLTGINDPGLTVENDRFGLQLYYNRNTAGSTANANWNGNISAEKWGSGGYRNQIQTYTYNQLNRIITGNYPTGSSPTQSFASTYVYDDNGNLKNLTRRGLSGTFIDQITYGYKGNNSNRLDYATDASLDIAGVEDFPGTLTGTNHFQYDLNGNLTRDDYRSLSLKYNPFNLPWELDFGSNKKINYYYNGAGVKLSKVVLNGANPPVCTEYMGQFVHQYTQGGTSSLKYIITPEGRLKNKGTNAAPIWEWEYNLADHLGNVRVVFRPGAGNTAELMEYTNYFPFGMKMTPGLSQSSTDNKNLYNGKEQQTDFGLNWYDYGARFYDATMGRWHCVDPHAENYYSWSPYHYAANNPLIIIDPDGRDWYTSNDGTATMWRKGSADIEGYKNIGSSYTQNIGNGVSVGYTQNQATSMTTNTMTSDQWISQYSKSDWDGTKANEACNKASDAMLTNNGNSSSGMKIIVDNAGDGRAGTANGNATNAIIDMSQALDSDKPTKVNVDFRSGTASGDKMGDHFIVVQGKTEQLSNGKVTSTTFNFFDPGTNQRSKGTSSSNILRIENNRLVGTHINNGRPIVVSSIRPTR